jgi:hypothetical protein
MPTPPLNFIEPRDAVQRVRDAFVCTREEAIEFLCDNWIEGGLVPRFLGPTPPDAIRHDTSLIDWFSGAVVKTLHLQRRTVRKPGQHPEHTVHTDRYRFTIDRRQLETVLKAVGAAASAAERHKTEPASDASETGDDRVPEAPRDTMPLRGKARMWLAAYVASGKHQKRDTTLEAMREAHPGLGVRGSLMVWAEFAKENPHLQLSRRGAKLKRNTNN